MSLTLQRDDGGSSLPHIGIDKYNYSMAAPSASMQFFCIYLPDWRLADVKLSTCASFQQTHSLYIWGEKGLNFYPFQLLEQYNNMKPVLFS